MSTAGPANRPTEPEALVLEAWGQGMMVGALVVMAALTIANMRKGVLLHKLILAEAAAPDPGVYRESADRMN